jgi:GT2 family glycosyltransferase
MRSLIEHVDLFVAPSQTLAERFAAFGIPADRLVRCDQGIKIATPPRGPARTGGPLRLLFAGSFLPSKAPHLLLEAAAVLPPGTVVVDMAGGGTAYHGDNRYAGRLAPLTRQPFVRLHGHVPHERVRDLLSVADALVVPSVWIENAPFVIKEAFASGVPVVASDLGGMAELVTHGVNGLLFAPDDAGALAGQLRRLQLEPGLLEQLRSGIVPPITIEEDAEQHRRLYRRLSEHRSAGTRSPQASTGTPGRDGRVTAVVLNYRTPDQTWLSVRSLESSFDPPTEIIVVHNDSDSGSGIRPAWSGEMDAGRQSGPDGHEQGRAAPEVHLVRTGRNLGFSGGVNVGIAEGLARGADFLLLVNSDAWLAPDAIGLLLDASARQPETGIFAPLVLSREEPGRIATAGIDYSTASGRMRNRLAGAPAETAPSQPFPVAAVSGCVMLIRRAVLERAGTFDEQYFFSFEDVEFCVRAAGAGFGTMCVPGARAWHQGAGSMGQRSPRRVYFATRNHLRLAAGLEPSPVRRALRGGVIVGLNVAYVLTSPDAPLVAGLAAVARGTSDHLRGRYGADPAAQIADVGLHQGQFLHEVVDLLPLPGDDDREGQRDHEDEEDEHQNKDGGGIRDTEETRCEVQRVAPEREDEQRRRAHDPEDRVLLGEPAPSHQLEDEPQEGSADDRCEDLSDVSHAAGDPRRRGRGPSAGPATYGRTQGRRAPG